MTNAEPNIVPVVIRDRDAAKMLAISERQVGNLVADGVLRRIRIPGIRSARLSYAEVKALAEGWVAKGADVDAAIGNDNGATEKAASQ